MSSHTTMITTDSFRALFSELSSIPGAVTWARRVCDNQFIHIGDEIKSVFDLDAESIFSSFERFYQVVPLEQDRVIVKRHVSKFGKLDVPLQAYYRVNGSGSKFRFIKDTAFAVKDQAGQIVIVAGVARTLTERQWHAEQTSTQKVNCDFDKLMQPFSQPLVKRRLSCIAPLSFTVAKVMVDIHGRKVQLTRRELQSTLFAMQSYTAKDTAKLMGISNRTVDNHLDSVKVKTGACSKIDLINLMHEAALIDQLS